MAAVARAPWLSGAEQMKLRQRGRRPSEEVGGGRLLVARGGRDGAASGGGVELRWGHGVWVCSGRREWKQLMGRRARNKAQKRIFIISRPLQNLIASNEKLQRKYNLTANRNGEI